MELTKSIIKLKTISKVRPNWKNFTKTM